MTEALAHGAPSLSTRDRPGAPALQPTRDLRATLPDLLDVLLNKGVYLDLDLIITVADIPLIGVNLRAVVAGIETMLEHGMMRGWDEQTREWVRRSLARHVPLADDEDVVARMAGGHRRDDPPTTWRPGTVYLTSRRLMVWRADPRELLWQSPLEEITGVALHTEPTVGGEERTRVAVTTPAGTTLLSAAAPERLASLLSAGPDAASGPREDPDVLRAPVWYQEDRADSPVWRGGTGALGPDGLTWQGAGDARPAVRLRQVEAVEVHDVRTPVGRQVLLVRGGSGTVHLATRDAEWARALAKAAHDGAPEAVPEIEGGD